MFYLTEVEDYVRVEPKHFGLATKEAVSVQLKESYVNSVTKDLGFVISVIDVDDVGEGIIIPGDGAAYYKSRFRVLVWKPELHELVFSTVKEITTFGAFMEIGKVQGMIHISQTMEDFVSLSKTGTLQGRSTRRSLSIGDNCMSRIVAISFKSGEPKISLTMRQPGLGKLEWLDEDKAKAKKVANKSSKAGDKKVLKKGGKKK